METKKPKILMVEDDPSLPVIYIKVFEENGFEILFLNSAKNIIEEAIKYKPDIISMDIIMPDMDGLKATKLLKLNQETKDIPVIGFANFSEKEMLKSALDAGMENYLTNYHHTPQEYVNIIKNYLEIPDTQVINSYTSVKGSQRGVFVLLKKLPTGEEDFIAFMPQNNTQKMLMSEKQPLAMFNEILFANWYLVNLREELKKNPNSNLSANDSLFISGVQDQERWDYIRKAVLNGGGTSAVLNPCIAKDHQCPTYIFDLKDETDFNKMKEWFSKCQTKHYTLKGYEKSGLVLLKKPGFDEKGEFKLLEE